jgi:transposase-like protein
LSDESSVLVEPEAGVRGFVNEFERRCWAVRRVVDDHLTVVAAAREVGRSEQWLHKWLRRYENDGRDGLRDRSRAPHGSPNRLGPEVAAAILKTRERLEHSEFGNRGAEAIRFELLSDGCEPLPSISTIDRVLRRAGRSGSRSASRKGTRPCWSPSVSAPGRWQQADWVGPRWLGPAVSFSSLNVVDVGGGAGWADQHPNQRLPAALRALTDAAWPQIGIPLHLSVDGAFAMQHPFRKLNPFNSFVRGCLLFGVELIVTPPNELGWQNHIESFNNLWQDRTLRRHRYRNLEEMRASSQRFCHYYLHQRPSPRLRTHLHGTRIPATLIENLRHQLRFPPPGFCLADYTNQRGNLTLPLARGRLTYLCRVHTGGTILVAKAPFPVPTSLEGQVVAATILTGSRRLIVRLDGHTVATHHFPVPQTPIGPYHTPAHRGLYNGIPPSTIT